MKENKMEKKCKNVVGKKTWPTPKNTFKYLYILEL